jgi:adenylate cyclase
LQPEEVIHILNIYLEQMADVIERYQGTIDEFMGDGILVLFGAPTAREDDALRAIACACAMQLAMGVVNEQMKQMKLPQLEMGIGIHTGEVVVGNLGSEKRTKYGVVGSQVNLTYRIESYTKGGQILVSQETLKAAGPNVKVSGQKQVHPKGIKHPITIYDIYGVSGLYNLYLPKEEEQFFAIPQAIPLQYSFLDGKQVNHALFNGRLIKLSARGAEILAETPNRDELPTESMNIKLNLLIPSYSADRSEDIYAQVVARQVEQHSFCVHFTGVPSSIRTQLTLMYRAIAQGSDAPLPNATDPNATQIDSNTVVQ